jgi:5'-3' exoribonuclease 1
MGIPSYTKRLLKSNQVIETPEKIDNLFIDFNGMIHPSSHKVIKKYTELGGTYTKAFIETAIIKQCCDDLQSVVKMTTPSGLLYIAVDGVAPFAKLKQQRLRRFKIKEDSSPLFNSSSITPGTIFMDKLNKRVQVFCNKTFKHLRLIFSGSDIPGEGEHKLINYLRNTPEISEETSVLFGLDADLVMLTLSTHLNHLYIFREEQDPQVIKDYGSHTYINVQRVRDYLLQDVVAKTGIESPDICTIINDYILLCFLGGNDFIGHIPSIEIKCGSLDKLMDLYWEFLLKENTSGYLTTNFKINWSPFKKFMNNLASKEQEMVVENHKLMSKRKSPDAELPSSDPIKFHTRGWELRYYQEYFLVGETVEPEEIKEWSNQYIDTLEWILMYYSGKCIDNQHYFNHNHTPILRDINKQLQKRTTDTIFKETPFCSPHEQLLCVLPPSSFELLPKEYRIVAEKHLAHCFPIKCIEDTSYCTMNWQAKVIFPPVDFAEMIRVAKANT